MKKATLSIESLESKRPLASVRIAPAPVPGAAEAAQVRVMQARPVLNAPSFIGVYRGSGSLGGISVSGSENTLPILVLSTGRRGTITSTINDGSVRVYLVGNSSGGTTLYMGGSPSAINRNMRYLTYRGSEPRIQAQLFICNVTSCTKYADLRIPIRNF